MIGCGNVTFMKQAFLSSIHLSLLSSPYTSISSTITPWRNNQRKWSKFLERRFVALLIYHHADISFAFVIFIFLLLKEREIK